MNLKLEWIVLTIIIIIARKYLSMVSWQLLGTKHHYIYLNADGNQWPLLRLRNSQDLERNKKTQYKQVPL